MPKLTTIYWRDIPAQVIGHAGKDRHKRALAPRFQEAIDRAAMRAGRGSSEAYLEDWRRECERVEGGLEALVAARVGELEAEFSADSLESTVKAGGWLPGAEDPADG
jgi:hypothetical protein